MTMPVSRTTIRKSTTSIWTLSLLFVTLAAALQLAGSQSVEFTDSEPSTDTIGIGAQREILICSGICDDGEGVLKDPDLVIEYQWNRRVPVCSGLSCDTASCGDLEIKLGQLQLSEFECERHKYELQRNGCACTEAEPTPPPTPPPITPPTEPPKVAEPPKVTSSINESENLAVETTKMKPGMKIGVAGIAVLVALGLFAVIYIGVKHDEKLQARRSSRARKQIPEMLDEASYAEA